MAKLSAHGYEVARVKTEGSRFDSFDGRELHYEYTYSYRSDGHILRRIVCLNLHPHGSPRQDFGWKLHLKLNDEHRRSYPKGGERDNFMRGLAQRKADAAERRSALVKHDPVGGIY